MPLIDLEHTFYHPLATRVIITIVCLGWAVFEFISGTPFWGMLFGALGTYAGYQFFIVYPKLHTTTNDDTGDGN